MQSTIKSPVRFQGFGLHSGQPACATVRPAPSGHGIVFRRVDLIGTDLNHGLSDAEARVPALWDHVQDSPLNTRIVNRSGVSVSTIEHLMAALAGCGVHNALIDLDGPEVPILDGSAAAFVNGMVRAGLTRLNAPLRAIEICKTVEVRQGPAMARLSPATTLQIDFSIDFADAAIGQQSKTLNMANGSFVRELSDSRTFCRQADVDMMRAQGLALGGTLDNAVVVDGAQVLSPGGLRHPDEAVRHKMLDALGDLFTAGAPILGRYTGVRAGHALTNRLLRALMAQPDAWAWVICDDRIAARLPGVGVHLTDLPAVA